MLPVRPCSLTCSICGKPLIWGSIEYLDGLCDFCKAHNSDKAHQMINPLIPHYTLDIRSDFTGLINSDDCEGEGIRISHRKDIIELIELIYHMENANTDDVHWFHRCDDGVKIMGYRSKQKEGFFVIQRENGNWFRLSRYDLVMLKEELKIYL